MSIVFAMQGKCLFSDILRPALLFNDTFFCKCPELIYLDAKELFMFLFFLLTFFKIKLLQINHLGPPSEYQTVGSRSRPTFCWSSSGFKLFAKGYWQTTLSAGIQRVITGKYLSVQYIVSYR